MSVGMFVTNPSNDFETGLYVPFATETLYNEFVYPISLDIGATILSRFGVGLEITASDFPQLTKELDQLKAKLPPNAAVTGQIMARTTHLLNEMRSIFDRNAAAVVYIG